VPASFRHPARPGLALRPMVLALVLCSAALSLPTQAAPEAVSAPASGVGEQIRRDATEAGRSLGEAGRQIGQGAAKVGRTLAEDSRDAASGVARAARAVSQTARHTGTTVWQGLREGGREIGRAFGSPPSDPEGSITENTNKRQK